VALESVGEAVGVVGLDGEDFDGQVGGTGCESAAVVIEDGIVLNCSQFTCVCCSVGVTRTIMSSWPELDITCAWKSVSGRGCNVYENWQLTIVAMWCGGDLCDYYASSTPSSLRFVKLALSEFSLGAMIACLPNSLNCHAPCTKYHAPSTMHRCLGSAGSWWSK